MYTMSIAPCIPSLLSIHPQSGEEKRGTREISPPAGGFRGQKRKCRLIKKNYYYLLIFKSQAKYLRMKNVKQIREENLNKK